MSNAADTPTTQLEPIPAYKRRKSSKVPMVHAATIAKFASGESKSKISKDLGIARNTVAAILSQSEIEHHVLAGRSRAIQLIPAALNAVEYRINEKRDGNVALGVLRGTQVLVSQQITQNTTNNFAFMIAQLKKENEDSPDVRGEGRTLEAEIVK